MNAEIEITSGAATVTPDELKRLEDRGVSRVVIPPPGFDKEAVQQGLEQLGENVLARL